MRSSNSQREIFILFETVRMSQNIIIIIIIIVVVLSNELAIFKIHIIFV
jgi:hypothetical protein